MNDCRVLLLCLVVMVTLSTSSLTFAEEVSPLLSIGADFRYRHELIDVEHKDIRNRHRIRARLNVNAELQNNVLLGIQFATGGDNPVSSNQSLNDGFSSKSLVFDLAYIDWQPQQVEGLKISAGKFKNPFFTPGKTELLWDSDLRHEGVTVSYAYPFKNVNLFLNTSYLWVEERKTDNDAILLGGQAGMKLKLEPFEVRTGLGYFDYRNTMGAATFYDAEDSAGNSTTQDNYYIYDYDEVELFSEIVVPGLIYPTMFFFDYVSNIAENVKDNQGWLAGLMLGKCKNPGSYDFRYNYRHIEKDAVIGTFTDSDFIGGGTDGKGHEVNLNYQLSAKVKCGLSYFLNREKINNGEEYHRFQFDMMFKL